MVWPQRCAIQSNTKSYSINKATVLKTSENQYLLLIHQQLLLNWLANLDSTSKPSSEFNMSLRSLRLNSITIGISQIQSQLQTHVVLLPYKTLCNVLLQWKEEKLISNLHYWIMFWPTQMSNPKTSYRFKVLT